MEFLGDSKGFRVESPEEKSAKNEKKAEVISGLYRILADEKTGANLSNSVLGIATVVQGHCSKEALDKEGVKSAINAVETKLQSDMAKKDITPETASFVKKAFELVGNAHKKIGMKEPIKTQSAPSPTPVGRTYLQVPSATYGSTSEALRNSAPPAIETNSVYGQVPGQMGGASQRNSGSSARSDDIYQVLPKAPEGQESKTGFAEKFQPTSSSKVSAEQDKKDKASQYGHIPGRKL